jgi:cytosine/adenosine deaminase-related metal-dependent hydrolase
VATARTAPRGIESGENRAIDLRLSLPGFVNAHSHAFLVVYVAYGAAPVDGCSTDVVVA